MQINKKKLFCFVFFLFKGALFGTICGVSVALGVASTFEGGLNEFLTNTVQNYSVIAGAGTSIGKNNGILNILNVCYFVYMYLQPFQDVSRISRYIISC